MVAANTGVEIEDVAMGTSQAPISEQGLDPIGTHADLSKINAPRDVDIPVQSRWQDLAPNFLPPSQREPAMTGS